MKKTPEQLRKQAEYMRNYFRTHPEQRKKHNESYTKWRKNHRKKVNAHNRNYYHTHPEIRIKKKELARINRPKYYQKLKKLVIAHYSNNTFKCNCCKETEYLFLTLDHINNEGWKHRRELSGKNWKAGSDRTYAWLRRNNFPAGFQILCHNCNWGKRYGICPHKLASNEHTN